MHVTFNDISDSKILNAMEYITKNRHGYMKELKPFGEDVVNSLESVGFLKTGWTKEEETFGVTESLKRYYELVRNN